MLTVLLFNGGTPLGWSEAEPLLYETVRSGELRVITPTEEPEVTGPYHLVHVLRPSSGTPGPLVRSLFAGASRSTIVLVGSKAGPLPPYLDPLAPHPHLMLRLADPGDSLELALLIHLLVRGEWPSLPSPCIHRCQLDLNKGALARVLFAYEQALVNNSEELRQGYNARVTLALHDVGRGFDLSQWLDGRTRPLPALPPDYRPSSFASSDDLTRWEGHVQRTVSAIHSHSIDLDRLSRELVRSRSLAQRNNLPEKRFVDPWELSSLRAEIENELYKARQDYQPVAHVACSLESYRERAATIKSAAEYHLLSRSPLSLLAAGVVVAPALYLLGKYLLTIGPDNTRAWAGLCVLGAVLSAFSTFFLVLANWQNRISLNHQLNGLVGATQEVLNLLNGHFVSRLQDLAKTERVQVLRRNLDEVDRALIALRRDAEQIITHRGWLRDHAVAARVLLRRHCCGVESPSFQHRPQQSLRIEASPSHNPLYSPLSYADCAGEAVAVMLDGATHLITIANFDLVQRVSLTLEEVY